MCCKISTPIYSISCQKFFTHGKTNSFLIFCLSRWRIHLLTHIVRRRSSLVISRIAKIFISLVLVRYWQPLVFALSLGHPNLLYLFIYHMAEVVTVHYLLRFRLISKLWMTTPSIRQSVIICLLVCLFAPETYWELWSHFYQKSLTYTDSLHSFCAQFLFCFEWTRPSVAGKSRKRS